MLLKQDQMPKIVGVQQKDIVALTEISKQAEIIIQNDIKNAQKDVIKFSTAAQELRDFVLTNEDSDPLLVCPQVNPFKGATLAERMAKLCK
ncbi:Oidioi.mRNA.OKI2018_I69.chr2.g6569.t1.cds [Oikopleura dioica]|uniref:Oidioi.mRNA.OKI2018_I69.chr2.g6569.t1.cds n=1 Tax=Oikopleura dioica TaxID=34765 RepID=A0ABN7TCQ9_OIKDI|nr:Oidioi.mRNA.OKI2018_I69.chr2.g6569.t1.cds [Oikopleura dioica]